MARCRYCPPFLLSFLRRSRAAAGHVLADAEYDALAELLASESGSGNQASEAPGRNAGGGRNHTYMVNNGQYVVDIWLICG